MGLADYLSKYRLGVSTLENENDKKFVVDAIQEIKHLLLKHNVNPIGVIKPTGKLNQKSSSTQNELNDVTH